MAEIKHIHSIADLNQLLGGASARHPLLEVIDLSQTAMDESLEHQAIHSALYSITIKTKSNTPFRYGRQYYDFTNGTLIAMEPGQTFSVEKAHQRGDLAGLALYFHPDFLLGSPLHQQIQQYGYFAYDINEALHLSEQEQRSLMDILRKIEQELEQNMDDFSQQIQQANLELLLKYINRYFNRQFITRKHNNHMLVTQAKQVLQHYFQQQHAKEQGLPSVSYLAEKLHLSANYLSDLLKKETGTGAQELIHQQVIELAKYQLLNSESNVSQIAFELGFDYPQYFSRLFKQKTGLTPAQFRKMQ